MKDFYTDAILGEWAHDKKNSTKTDMCYNRKATVRLHKDNAMTWTDPETFEQYKIHGEVVLTERKLINIKNSNPSIFRGVEFTKETVKVPMIK